MYVPGKDLSRCLSDKGLVAAGSFLRTSLTVRKVYEPCLGKIIFFYRWWCHFDDDNYVHVLRLAHLLQSYSADRPVYLGKPSTARPIEIWDLNAPQVRTYFLQWFINDFAQENTLFDMQMYQKGSWKQNKIGELSLYFVTFFVASFRLFFHNVMQQLNTHIPTGLHNNYPINIPCW